MTLAEIIALAREDVAEPNPAFFTDTGIMLYFNEAQLDFSRKVRPIRLEAALALSLVDKLSATLPADFLEVDFVHLTSVDGDKPTIIKRYSGDARSRQSLLSKDTGYYIISTAPKTMKLTSEQNPPDDSLVVSYFAKPAPYADPVVDAAVESDIPDEYVDIVIMAVVARMKRKRREFQEARIDRAEYEKLRNAAALYEKSRDGKAILNIRP